MTHIPTLRQLLIGAGALGLLLAPPASAQLSVYDPTNYAQNVLQASRALQQINNQIISLQNEAQTLINQARNLTSLPTNTRSQLRQSIDRTRQLIGEAQQIAYNVQDIDRVFDARYPAGSLSNTSSGQLVSNADARWRDAVGSFQDSLRTQATIVTNLGDTRAQIDTLVGASQDAAGALQAAQAGNQLIALQTRQLADLTALVAAQSRAASIEAARAAADEAQGREQTRRFIGVRSDYVARPVTFSVTEDRQKGRGAPTRRLLTGRLGWRAIIFGALVAVPGTAAIVVLGRPASDASLYSVSERETMSPPVSSDSKTAELIRCRALPPGMDDMSCRAAWEASRRRFFGETRTTRAPAEPLPKHAPVPVLDAASPEATAATPTSDADERN